MPAATLLVRLDCSSELAIEEFEAFTTSCATSCSWRAVHMAIPRIGQEVIVDYLDGDCDQPIVTGRTYRATNRPPVGS